MNDTMCNLNTICSNGYSFGCINDDYILVSIHRNYLEVLSSIASIIMGVYMIWAYISILKFFGLTLREKILLSIILVFSPQVYFASKHPNEFIAFWDHVSR